MRVRLPLGRSLYFACAFLFCLVALLPLRLGLAWFGMDGSGFAAREAIGSLWTGAVREAEFGPVALGDLGTRLRVLPLLVGRARVDLSRPGDETDFKAAMTATRHGFGLDDANAKLDVASAFAPLPIQGLDLSGVTAHFAEGLCVSAKGLVTARVGSVIAGVPLPSSFIGEVRCQAGALLLPLSSGSGQEGLAISLFADGRYKVEVTLPPGDESNRQRLAAAGFAATGAGYVLRAEGKFAAR